MPAPVTSTDADPEVAFLAVRLVTLAETLWLVPTSLEPGVAPSQVDVALDAFARAGVGRDRRVAWEAVTSETRSRRVRAVWTAVEESPLPEFEWLPLIDVLGEDSLAGLVDVSLSSVRRYSTGERPTPDPVAVRLHALALVTTDLAGSYNAFGIRRWFGRARSALDGRSPASLLAGAWSPEDAGPQQVRALAAALLAPSAT